MSLKKKYPEIDKKALPEETEGKKEEGERPFQIQTAAGVPSPNSVQNLQKIADICEQL